MSLYRSWHSPSQAVPFRSPCVVVGWLGKYCVQVVLERKFTDKANSLFHRAFFGYAALRFRSYGFTVVVNATATF
jgi:hypothetical protein